MNNLIKVLGPPALFVVWTTCLLTYQPFWTWFERLRP
jgi:hypothetical protein